MATKKAAPKKAPAKKAAPKAAVTVDDVDAGQPQSGIAAEPVAEPALAPAQRRRDLPVTEARYIKNRPDLPGPPFHPATADVPPPPEPIPGNPEFVTEPVSD